MSQTDPRTRGFRAMITGERGKLAICELFLSWGWLPRPLDGTLDQGVDIMVELANDGIGYGVHFAVQSKASDGRAKIASDGVGMPLKARNVDYLINQRVPVFIMFADVAGKTAYWAEAKACLKTTARKRDGSVYLKLPAANRIDLASNSTEFRAAFLDAVKMTDPSWAVPEMSQLRRSVGAAEDELNSLDPRIRVAVSVGSDQSRYELRLLQDIDFQTSMGFKSLDEAEKLREALDYGLSTSVQLDSFAMSGSPLVDHLMKGMTAGQFTVEAAPGEVVAVYLGTPAAPNGTIQNVLQVKGPIRRGMKGGNLIASSDEHPITVEIRVFGDRGASEVSIGTDITAWVGKRLAPMTRLVEAAHTLDEIISANRFAFGINSRRFDSSTVGALTSETAEMLQSAATVLAKFDDLRELATRYGKDLRIERSDLYYRSEPEWWTAARKIVDGEVVELASRQLTLNGEFAPEAETLLAKESQGHFIISNAPLIVTACGDEICHIPVDVLAQNFDAVWPTRAESRTEVKLSPGADSRLYIRRHSSAPFHQIARKL